MNSTCEAFDNAKRTVDDLAKWSKVVGGARSIGSGGVGVIFIKVDCTNEHGRIWPWHREDDHVCTTFQVSKSLMGDVIHVVRS